MMEYINIIAAVFTSVTVISTVWNNQKFIKDQIKNLHDMLKEQMKKHDDHEAIFYEKHNEHEKRIIDIENEIKNIHMHGCNRRNSFNCREEV